MVEDVGSEGLILCCAVATSSERSLFLNNNMRTAPLPYVGRL